MKENVTCSYFIEIAAAKRLAAILLKNNLNIFNLVGHK